MTGESKKTFILNKDGSVFPHVINERRATDDLPEGTELLSEICQIQFARVLDNLMNPPNFAVNNSKLRDPIKKLSVIDCIDGLYLAYGVENRKYSKTACKLFSDMATSVLVKCGVAKDFFLQECYYLEQSFCDFVRVAIEGYHEEEKWVRFYEGLPKSQDVLIAEITASGGLKVPPRPKQQLYIMENEFDLIKIGISKDPSGRAKQIANNSGVNTWLLSTHVTTQPASQVEAKLHAHFSDHRRKGEWFSKDVLSALNKQIKVMDRQLIPVLQVTCPLRDWLKSDPR